MPVVVANLMTVFGAEYGTYEKGAKVVETTNKRLDGTTVTTTVDADVRDAEQGLDDIQDALEELHDTTARPEVLPDADAARGDLDDIDDLLGDIDSSVARPKIDPEGLRDFKDEAQDTAREGAASFTGEFDDVADIIQETLANSLVGFGPAGAAAGLALAGGFGIALSQLQKVADEANAAKEASVELATAVVDAGGSISNLDPTDRVVDWSTTIVDQREAWEVWQESATTNLDEVRRQAEATGTSVVDLLAAFVGGDPEAADRVLKAHEDRLAGIRAELDVASTAQAEWSAQQAAAIGYADAALDPYREQISVLEEQAEAFTSSTEEIRANTENLLAAQEASDIMRAAAEGLTVSELQYRDALEEANAALLDHSGTTRDAAHAYIDLEEQVAATQATMADAEASDRDRRATLIDLADQIVATATAVEEAEGSTHAYNDVIRQSRADFIEASTAAGIAGQAAEDLADSYGLIPKNVTTVVQADTDPARRAVTKLIDDITGKTVGIRVGAGLGAIEARAGGGDVNAGQVYRVGELGEELFVPDVAGTIIPAAQTAQILNANPGATAMSAQSFGPTTATFTDAQVERLALAFERGAARSAAGYSAAQDRSGRYLGRS